MAEPTEQDNNSDETLNVTDRREDEESPQEEVSDSGHPSPSVESEAAASPSGDAPASPPAQGLPGSAEADIRARYEAELQAAGLRENLAKAQVSLLEERLKNAELRAELAEKNSAGPSQDSAQRSSSSASSEPATRQARRDREAEWDKLPYVPVSNFLGNPFLGPAQGSRFPNVSRPQCFELHHNPVHQKLVESKSSMRYEYEILHPLLYYSYALKEFGEGELLACIADPQSSPEARVEYLEAYLNTYARIYDWFVARHALIEERARASKDEHSAAFLEHLQDEMYAFVGAPPDTSGWLANIKATYADNVSSSKLKALARAHAAAKKKVGASGGASGGQGAGGKRQAAFGKRGGGSLPLSEVGKSVGGSK